LIASIIAFSFFHKLDLFLRPILPGYLRRRCPDMVPATQIAIRSWLSLIERSPNAATPA
jgi:hypothetical protein